MAGCEMPNTWTKAGSSMCVSQSVDEERVTERWIIENREKEKVVDRGGGG